MYCVFYITPPEAFFFNLLSYENVKTNQINLINEFNKLNRQVKTNLTKFRQQIIEAKFLELKNFNQSSAKHWKIIRNIQADGPIEAAPTTIYADGSPITSNAAIADKFARSLSTTFGGHIHLPNLPTFQHPNEATSIVIDQHEFDSAISNCNKKSAPGNDGISNKMITSSPPNISSFTYSNHR